VPISNGLTALKSVWAVQSRSSPNLFSPSSFFVPHSWPRTSSRDYRFYFRFHVIVGNSISSFETHKSRVVCLLTTRSPNFDLAYSAWPVRSSRQYYLLGALFSMLHYLVELQVKEHKVMSCKAIACVGTSIKDR
jgi:hypothetical protein